MGWIYGSTIVNDINSTTSANAIAYQYDKIFSNRYLMDNTSDVDGIFLGRKVLVDYHQSLTDTLNRLVKITSSEAGKTKTTYYYWREIYVPVSLNKNQFNQNELLESGKKQYYYLNEKGEYILITEWLDFKDDTQFFEYKPYTVLDLVSQASISYGTYVYILTGDNPYDLTNITLLQCNSELIATDTNKEATFNSDSELETWRKEYIDSKSPITVYGFNRFVDEKYFPTLDYPYDSTVWQKVYINNEEKYLMISQLNANNPTIDLHVKQPGFNGIAAVPNLNVDNKDKYDLFVSSQSGFRISNEPYYKVNVYIPGRYYTDSADKKSRIIANDEKYNPNARYYATVDGDVIKMHYTEYPGPGKIYRKVNDVFELDNTEKYLSWKTDDVTGKPIEDSHFVFLSDETCKYYQYTDNNTISPIDNVPAAIYYNQAGLQKEKNHLFDTSIQEDCIAINFDGKSGYNYTEENYYELIKIKDENDFNSNKSNLYYLLSDKGYAKVENYILIPPKVIQDSYEPNKYYYFNEEESQYKLDENETITLGRDYYKYECVPYNNSLEYYLLKTTNSDGIDTHQLSINLPTIGNMVCEGWNLIYGTGDEEGKRNLNRYEYNYATNSLTGDKSEVNRKEDNLTGLYNIYAEEVKRLRGYDESFSSTTTDNMKASIPLITTTEINEGVEFTATHKLEGNDIIQNQIAINNLGLENIAEQIGFDISESIGYELIPNITAASYQPNLYYYKTDSNIFVLDSADKITEGRQYYVRRINKVKLSSDNPIAGTIQTQINENYNQRENNRIDLTFRRDDIHNIAELVGLLKTSDGNETAAATLSIKPREAANVDDSDNLVYDNTIQGQIYRNDADIANLIDLLGFSRNGYDQLEGGNSELVITNEGPNNKIEEGKEYTLQNQIICNNYDIQKLANRIRRIEEFLEAGHFLFYYGRPSNLKNYNKDRDYKIPGEPGYDDTVEPVNPFESIN